MANTENAIEDTEVDNNISDYNNTKKRKSEGVGEKDAERTRKQIVIFIIDLHNSNYC